MNKDEIADACLLLLGKRPDEISYPGGEDRKTLAVKCDGRDLILSKRRSIGRAKLEAEILSKLGKSGHVPRLVAHQDQLVVQELIAGERLTLSLDRAPQDEVDKLLIAGIDSLLKVQDEGHKRGLTQIVPKIGTRENWENDLVDMPARLASSLDLPAPEYDRALMQRLIHATDHRFIKWDARPGNAILSDAGDIYWIDWEHSGARMPQDDLAWLMADEWTPPSIAAEEHLAKVLTPERFASWRAMAILHSCIRLGLIVDRKPEGKWWNHEKALEKDRIGVTRGNVLRACKKAARWSDPDPATQPLVRFFKAVAESLLA